MHTKWHAMRFRAFPIFRFCYSCETVSYLPLIFAAIFAPLIRFLFLLFFIFCAVHSLTLFLPFIFFLLLVLSSFLFLSFPVFFCFSVFFFAAFSFKLALKQFYDTISTKQINSLVTTTDCPLPWLPASLLDVPCTSSLSYAHSQWQRAFFLMRTAFIIRPVAHCRQPKQKHKNMINKCNTLHKKRAATRRRRRGAGKTTRYNAKDAHRMQQQSRCPQKGDETPLAKWLV